MKTRNQKKKQLQTFSFDFFLGSAAPFLALWLSLSRLNSVLAHRERPGIVKVDIAASLISSFCDTLSFLLVKSLCSSDLFCQPVHSVEFVVETAGIAHGLAIVVSPGKDG